MTDEALPGDHLDRQLKRIFGFDRFRPGQRPVIEAVLGGESVLAVMPTGSGKSLCYQLPAALLPGPTVVVSPLIALMQDQVAGLPAALASRATALHSGLDGSQTERRLRDIANGRHRLLFVAPERLRQRPFLRALARSRPSLVVVDEAHCVELWGDDFRPDYADLAAPLRDIGAPVVLALTATATPQTGRSIATLLDRPLRTMAYGVCRDNLAFEVRLLADTDAKLDFATNTVRESAERGVLYVNSRRRADALAERLRSVDVASEAYHAGLDPAGRTAIQERFTAGETRTLVATTAFGLGVDVADLRYVIHFDSPDSLERYVQESGRAGRDGAMARCLLLATPRDLQRLGQSAATGPLDLDRCAALLDAVRALTDGQWTLVPVDDLRRETGLEATEIRVGLACLVHAGFVQRGDDTPIGVAIRAAAGANVAAEWRAFVAALCPADGNWNDGPTDVLAEQAGAPLERFEASLLEAEEAGYLRYRATRREPLLRAAAPPLGAQARLERLVARCRTETDRRRRSVLAYIEGSGCRHVTLAAYYGQTSEGPCGRCDRCLAATAVPTGRPLEEEADDRERDLLRCIASLPYRLGVKGLVQLLRGSPDSPLPASRSRWFGLLREATVEDVTASIEAQIQRGRLRYRQDGTFRVIALTPAGIAIARGAEGGEPPGEP